MDMADYPTPLAHFDAKLRALEAEISKEEHDLQQRMEALAAKKARHKRLAEARNVYAEEFPAELILTPSPSEAEEERPTEPVQAPQALWEVVLRIVEENPKPSGISPGEVTKILADQGLGSHIAPRTFYSMIYMNLKKLAIRGRLVSKQGPNGRLFFPAPGRSKS